MLRATFWLPCWICRHIGEKLGLDLVTVQEGGPAAQGEKIPAPPDDPDYHRHAAGELPGRETQQGRRRQVAVDVHAVPLGRDSRALHRGDSLGFGICA